MRLKAPATLLIISLMKPSDLVGPYKFNIRLMNGFAGWLHANFINVLVFNIYWVRFYLSAGFLLVAFTSFSQSPDPVIEDYKKIPLAPSPNASSLGKFGETPVSPSTGVPDITIPMYNYSDRSKDLNLNVSLRYHAGGHKIEDMASNVGLGWALNAGGVIMRTMKGLPDDQENGYLNTPPLPLFNTYENSYHSSLPWWAMPISFGVWTPISEGICFGNEPTHFYTIRALAENLLDGEADIFSISVGDINEQFFFDKNGVPVFIRPNALQITPTYGTGGFTILAFTVTDSKGVKYVFDTYEQTYSAPPSAEPLSEVTYISSWYLSKIISADGKDEIQFYYDSAQPHLTYYSGFTHHYKVRHRAEAISVDYNGTFRITQLILPKRIASIVIPDGTSVVFNYSFPRADLVGDHGLTSISISSGTYSKTFRLAYSYFNSSNCFEGGIPCNHPQTLNDYTKRLRLDSVYEESGTEIIPSYQFEYNATELPYRNSMKRIGGDFTIMATAGTPSPRLPDQANRF